MSDYEIIGRVTCLLGASGLLLVVLLLILRGAWFAFGEIVGWARVTKAFRLLWESETDGQ